MLYFAILTCSLVICISAEFSVKCSNNSESSISFEPSSDGVKGRYNIVWCTQVDEDVFGWDIILRYYESRPPELCKHYNIKRPPPQGLKHSYVKYDGRICPNFTNACLSTSVDLIFKACYLIKNMLKGETHTRESFDSFHYVDNNFTNAKSLKTGTPAVTFVENEDYITAIWYLGDVPAVNYTMMICSINDTEPSETCADVSGACTGAARRVACRLRPRAGRARLALQHRAPWLYGALAPAHLHYDFNYTVEKGGAIDVTDGSAATAAWAAAALAALLALAAAAALLAHRARLLARLRRSVLAAWRQANETDKSEEVVKGEIRVLLLYARDCPALLHFVRCLVALLQHAAPGRVYDLYSPEVSAQAAGAPDEWLRAVLARDDVRVLLLQTPAAVCLHGAPLRPHGAALALERPLLGRRVVPRAPHCADALLALALRLLAAPQHRLPYRKFFIAHVAGLEAELAPLVTPQRRYALPAAAPLLLRHLRADLPPLPPPPRLPPPELQALQAAADELLAYVRDHPDYLNDELLFL